VFPDIFIIYLLVDLDIQNSKICLPIMLGAILVFWGGQKTFKRQHPFLKREYILSQIIFFLKN
jgi:hypothetical protein